MAQTENNADRVAETLAILHDRWQGSTASTAAGAERAEMIAARVMVGLAGNLVHVGAGYSSRFDSPSAASGEITGVYFHTEIVGTPIGAAVVCIGVRPSERVKDAVAFCAWLERDGSPRAHEIWVEAALDRPVMHTVLASQDECFVGIDISPEQEADRIAALVIGLLVMHSGLRRA